jgi:cytochrome P450 family 4
LFTDGKIFPAHTNINIGIYLLCHNPEIFPNPEQFLPERFAAEQSHPYTYIPFSAGMRNCIGQKFALYEMKVMVVFMLISFRIKLANEDFAPILMADLILKSENGIKLKFEPR